MREAARFEKNNVQLGQVSVSKSQEGVVGTVASQGVLAK